MDRANKIKTYQNNMPISFSPFSSTGFQYFAYRL